MGMLITIHTGIAGGESDIKTILFKVEFIASGSCQGQDDESDTLKCHTPRGNNHNRYCHYFSGRPGGILLAQMGVTTPLTTSGRFNQCRVLQQSELTNISLLRDPTAYACASRRRSFHTRGRVERLHQGSKGNNLELENQVTKVLEKTKVSDISPLTSLKAKKSVSLVTLVQKDLQLYKSNQGTYNGLINILRNPEFLVACYEDIRGKPGNMTKGSTKETLDGIT